MIEVYQTQKQRFTHRENDDFYRNGQVFHPHFSRKAGYQGKKAQDLKLRMGISLLRRRRKSSGEACLIESNYVRLKQKRAQSSGLAFLFY